MSRAAVRSDQFNRCVRDFSGHVIRTGQIYVALIESGR